MENDGLLHELRSRSVSKLSGFFSAIFALEISIAAIYLALVFGGTPFGISSYVIESGSMEPNIPTGSLVYVDHDIEAEKMAPNEVVAFKIDGANTKVCTHRIVANYIETHLIRTKGDSNKEVDPTPVPYSSIIGRVEFSIPYLGYVAHHVTQNRIVVAFIYVCLLVCTSFLCRFTKRSRKSQVESDLYLRRGNTYGIKRCNAGNQT